MSSVDEIQSKILQELREIIKLEYLIEAELDSINAMAKPMGSFDMAVTEGIKSAEHLGNMLKVSLNKETQKYNNMRTDLPMKAMDLDEEPSK